MERKFTHPDDAPEGHRWQTLDGREATQVTAFDVGAASDQITAVVNGWLQTFTGIGEFSGLATHALDLQDVPVVQVRYLNIDTDGWSFKHPTRDIADQKASNLRIACIRVEYTEGRFDE